DLACSAVPPCPAGGAGREVVGDGQNLVPAWWCPLPARCLQLVVPGGADGAVGQVLGGAAASPRRSPCPATANLSAGNRPHRPRWPRPASSPRGRPARGGHRAGGLGNCAGGCGPFGTQTASMAEPSDGCGSDSAAG